MTVIFLNPKVNRVINPFLQISNILPERGAKEFTEGTIANPVSFAFICTPCAKMCSGFSIGGRQSHLVIRAACEYGFLELHPKPLTLYSSTWFVTWERRLSPIFSQMFCVGVENKQRCSISQQDIYWSKIILKNQLIWYRRYLRKQFGVMQKNALYA